MPASKTLNVGDKAPTFTLPTADGRPVSLADYLGRPVVVYFYPKDDTPGCTTQACGLRDAFPRFEGVDAVVLGVSPDDVKSHQKFKKKFDLPFTLVADTDHAIAESYGVWQEKSMYGRNYMGNARTTFVIDRKGRIAKVLEKVKPDAHTEQVLEALSAIE